MTIWNFIGFLGIIFTATQMLPQIIKSIKTKKVNDVSLGLILIVLSNAAVWIIYGWHLADYAIVIANILNLIASVTLLTLKLKSASP